MERISALMDGELDHDDVAKLVSGVNERGDLREAWETYHLIGDALRGQANGSSGSISLVNSVAAQLAKEPTILAPRRASGGSVKRFALPSLAAAAAVATVTWVSLETQQAPIGPGVAVPASHLILPAALTQQLHVLPEFAQASYPASTPTPSPPIQLPSRRIDAYLVAHQEFSPSTTMQGLASYVRTVTSDAADTGR